MDLLSFGSKALDFNSTDYTPAAATAGFTRRAFMMTSLAVGFAIASQPLLAQAITTDMRGITASEVKIPVADGSIPAYQSMPSAGKNFPVILVIQEIFGVHEHIKDMCRRYAKMGYLAIAPELFARQGDVSSMTDIGEILSKVVSKVPDVQVFSDLNATLAFVKDHKKGNTEKLGLVGYCWGGRTVWLYAEHNPNVKAGVAYYGLLNGMKSDIKANDPIDIAHNLKVPVLGLYASADAFIKPEIIEQMQVELEKSGSKSEIVVFPNVNHGFNADYRPSYNKTAADYAQKLAKDWLKNHGV
ncbi:MAG: dienelactone hydrolase family protein [Methylophilaceae bacterium]|nr:dienelactone hydrolase family protein [Methylophilaceae bacterium]